MSGGTTATTSAVRRDRRGVDGGKALDPTFNLRAVVKRRSECRRRAVGERRDLCPRALDAPRFHAVGEGKEKSDGRTFRPLADSRCAQNTQADEHVHVEPEVADRRKRARPHRPEASEC